VTAFAVPPALRDLADPWALTSARARHQAVNGSAALPVDAPLAAVDAALTALPDLDDPAPGDLPGELIDYFDFTAEWLAEAMPRLQDLTVPTAHAMLTERAGAPTPESATVALLAFWLRYITVGVAKDALSWLSDRLAGPDPGPGVDRFVQLISREVARQPVDLASTLLTRLSELGPAIATPVLTTVIADPATDAELRDHAVRYRRFLTAPPAGENPPSDGDQPE
jgi:hypothetical protein